MMPCGGDAIVHMRLTRRRVGSGFFIPVICVVAEYFLGHYWRHLEKVVPAYAKRRVPVGLDGLGTFCHTSQPLGCFYLPVRREPSKWDVGIEITPVPPQDG